MSKPVEPVHFDPLKYNEVAGSATKLSKPKKARIQVQQW